MKLAYLLNVLQAGLAKVSTEFGKCSNIQYSKYLAVLHAAPVPTVLENRPANLGYGSSAKSILLWP